MGDTWEWDRGRYESAIHRFSVSLASAGYGGFANLAGMRLHWVVGGTGRPVGVSEDGVRFNVWMAGRWTTIGQGTGSVISPEETRLDLGSAEFVGALPVGLSGTVHFAAAPLASNGLANGLVGIATDYVAATAVYRLGHSMEVDCTDGLDDDGDGDLDCADTDCFNKSACEFGQEQSCADSLDNDGDGLSDCADRDCWCTSDCVMPAGGCCAGQVLVRCLSDQVTTEDCYQAGTVQSCGWEGESGQMNCGEGLGPPGMGGLCPGVDCDWDCTGRECGGDGCGGMCGQCPAGKLCLDGLCECAPDCVDKLCGGDGCGGTCGDCEDGFECSGGECECVDKSCAPKGCGQVTLVGCCLDNVAYWCESGELLSSDCNGFPTCGWDTEWGYYYCGSDGNPDPEGEHPMDCGPLFPD